MPQTLPTSFHSAIAALKISCTAAEKMQLNNIHQWLNTREIDIAIRRRLQQTLQSTDIHLIWAAKAFILFAEMERFAKENKTRNVVHLPEAKELRNFILERQSHLPPLDEPTTGLRGRR